MAIRRHFPLILLAFSILSTTFHTPAQEPRYWSIALADSLMKRDTGAPGQWRGRFFWEPTDQPAASVVDSLVLLEGLFLGPGQERDACLETGAKMR
jgi:hypothetical protein